MHISQIKTRNAQVIVSNGPDLNKDSYHNLILNAAQALVNEGMGSASYLTSYQSNNSYWMSSDGKSIKVTPEGKVEYSLQINQ